MVYFCIMEKSDKIEILKTTSSEIPDAMMKDAFIALTVAMFQEWSLSSSHKYFLFAGLLTNLEQMGYGVEEMNAFKTSLNESIQKFNKTNSFMG